MTEKFLSDLHAARDQFVGNIEELSKDLKNMRKRLDDPMYYLVKLFIVLWAHYVMYKIMMQWYSFK